jgi:hypothetical protein
MYSNQYDIGRFMKWLPGFTSRSAEFREWADRAEPIIGSHLNRVLLANATETTVPPLMPGTAGAV